MNGKNKNWWFHLALSMPHKFQQVFLKKIQTSWFHFNFSSFSVFALGTAILIWDDGRQGPKGAPDNDTSRSSENLRNVRKPAKFLVVRIDGSHGIRAFCIRAQQCMDWTGPPCTPHKSRIAGTEWTSESSPAFPPLVPCSFRENIWRSTRLMPEATSLSKGDTIFFFISLSLTHEIWTSRQCTLEYFQLFIVFTFLQQWPWLLVTSSLLVLCSQFTRFFLKIFCEFFSSQWISSNWFTRCSFPLEISKTHEKRIFSGADFRQAG